MRFISTRGQSPPVGFIDVLLGGPAPDGGLYMPEEWPRWPPTDREFSVYPYPALALDILREFSGEAFGDEELREDIDNAYAIFDVENVVPFVKLGGNRFLFELFHGPTLAFKDIALQLLGRLTARALEKRKTRATIIVATSGDTGSAAIAAFRSKTNVDVVVLHPKGRVSEVQRRQMTTVLDDNVHNVALEGSFDDTQRVVKSLFSDTDFAARTCLTAMNSINLIRILAQAVYYDWDDLGIDVPTESRTFVVPTGNFGDVFAGEAMTRMHGVKETLIVATNSNDLLARALATGVYEPGPVHHTLSPSMDIQVASNFERALFTASGRDADWVRSAMAQFAREGRLYIPPHVLHALRRQYLAASASDEETIAAMRRVYAETGRVIDPHTATGFAVAEKLKDQLDGPLVFLATAHPAKFPEAIARAGLPPPTMPPALANIMHAKERCTVLPNDVAAVRQFILERTGT